MKNKEVEQSHINWQEKFNKEFIEKRGLPLEDYKFVAIGYLSMDEEFEKGEVSTNFLIKLKILWDEGTILASMGFHECEFCIDEGNYKNKGTSSSEKTLIDEKNKIKYIFPEMIFHYIREHNYLPPQEFIEFVMRS